MKLWNEYVSEYIDPNIIKKTSKLIQTKSWAKKNYSQFTELLTTSGDNIGLKDKNDPEPTYQDLNAGIFGLISKKGKENLILRLIQVISKSVGVNIATQSVEKLDEKMLLKVVNNIATEIGTTKKEGFKK